MNYFNGALMFDPMAKRWVVKNPSGEQRQLTSGNYFEMKVGGFWITTTVEYGEKYYATTPGLRLTIGLHARIPS